MLHRQLAKSTLEEKISLVSVVYETINKCKGNEK